MRRANTRKKKEKRKERRERKNFFLNTPRVVAVRFVVRGDLSKIVSNVFHFRDRSRVKVDQVRGVAGDPLIRIKKLSPLLQLSLIFPPFS